MLFNLPVSLYFLPTAGETVTDGISRSFQFGRYTLQNALPLISALVVVIGILAVVIIAMSIRQRKMRYIPHGLIKDPYIIRVVLETAVTQRSRFEVLFSSHGSKVPAYCTPLEVTGNSIILETSVLQNYTGNLVGREITCFFRVEENRKPQYFSFIAIIASMERSGEFWIIGLDHPKQLDRRQKRGYLRVSPPSQYVLGIAVWNDPANEKGVIPSDMREWASPVMVYVPPKRNQVSLLNISAGGIRLAVPHDTYKSANLEFNLSNRFVVLMDLQDIGTPQRLRFWTLCRIQNYYTDFTTQSVEIGLQFLFSGRPRESEPTRLYWQQLPEGGEIESIGNWSMRCHLEAFRESELTHDM